MKHRILFLSLLLLLTGAMGGVFALVHRGGGEQEILKETLRASVVQDQEQKVVQEITQQPTLAPQPLPPEVSSPININKAGYEELQEITGVGPAIAQRIIDYRNQHGPFQTIEEIKDVKGIGDATFEKMKDEIAI